MKRPLRTTCTYTFVRIGDATPQRLAVTGPSLRINDRLYVPEPLPDGEVKAYRRWHKGHRAVNVDRIPANGLGHHLVCSYVSAPVTP